MWIDKRPVPAGEKDPDAVPLSYMDHLWNRLDGMFTGTWASKFTSPRSMANWESTWAEAFVDEKITPDEIKRGLETIRRHKYGVPQLADFLAACRPVLTDEEAFYEAAEQLPRRRSPREVDGELVADDAWSEPAIFYAALRLESELSLLQYQQIKARWQRVLREERAKPWREIPVIRRALPPPQSQTLDETQQKQKIGEILQTLRKPSAKPANGRRTIAASDEDLGALKAAMLELVAHKQQREATAGEGQNSQRNGGALA